IGFGQMVSGDYYHIMGVSAILGRTILPEDDQPGAPAVIVLSHRYWQTRFAGRSDVIGKTVSLNRITATIVGVTGPEFRGTLLSGGRMEITVPLTFGIRLLPNSEELAGPAWWWLRVGGRLKPGVSMEQARATFEPVFRDSAKESVSPRDDVLRL